MHALIPGPARLLAAGVALAALSSQACEDVDDTLAFGFYAYFAPVSYSADSDPGGAGFDMHLGYEADLLTALEHMADGPRFVRRAIPHWAESPPPIWLRSAGSQFDVVGGGITILDSRTRDASGRRAVAFTSGHIAFRQSLLVRAADAQRFASYDNLDRDDAVGVIAGTTGESRLLQIVGYTDDAGALVVGARVTLADGAVVRADGTGDFFIAAAGASANVEGRRRIEHPVEDLPAVVYRSDENALITALREGVIDAVARGEIGNRDVAFAGQDLVVGVLDTEVEWGGFTVDAGAAALRACLDRRIDYLTDNRRIGYAAWREDPTVFLRRAWRWSPDAGSWRGFFRGWRLWLIGR